MVRNRKREKRKEGKKEKKIQRKVKESLFRGEKKINKIKKKG